MSDWIANAQKWVNANFIFFCILGIIALLIAGYIGHIV